MRKMQGLTLIELMVTISVLAIILGIAVPSFDRFVKSSRAEAQTSAMSSSLNLARSEAVKRGENIIVEAISSNWMNGWVVKTSADQIIRSYPAVEGDVTLAVTPNSSITFNSRGQLDGVALGSQVTLNYSVTGFCDLDREITINSIGRVSSNRGSCE